MNIITLGLSHRTAPIDLRERLWFSEDEVRTALPSLKKKFLRECVLISTCNRTELYGVAGEDGVDMGNLQEFLTKLKQADSYLHPEHFYEYSGEDAARQLFRVSSGVESMMLGDVQILGQVKEAYQLAQETKTIGLVTSKLFQSALHTGKRCRAETEISEGTVSISYGATELASKIYEDLRKKTVLLVGAGKTSELTLKHLHSKGVERILITNRTRSKAEELAQGFAAGVIEFENLRDELRQTDILISSVNSSGYVLTAADLSRAMKDRGNRPLLIIDIGVPRNIDPEANKIENIFLHDIDGLQIIVDKNLEKRKREVSKVERIIEEELRRFLRWQNSLHVNPTIEQLQSMAEEIRQQEVQKHHHRFRAEERETLELVTRRIISKLLHTPISNLKNGGSNRDEETLRMISTVREIFGLTPHDNESEPGEEQQPKS